MGRKLTTLDPMGWFSDTQAPGTFLWSPPTMAMETVLETMTEARHKWPEVPHILLVPRLMTYW